MSMSVNWKKKEEDGGQWKRISSDETAMQKGGEKEGIDKK